MVKSMFFLWNATWAMSKMSGFERLHGVLLNVGVSLGQHRVIFGRLQLRTRPDMGQAVSGFLRGESG